MKQLIVLIAILPLLLVFFVQFSLDQKNNTRLGLFSDYVYVAKEEAKQAGCFTEEISEKLRNSIAVTFDIIPSEVIILATETVRYRIMATDSYAEDGFERGLIYYKISVPISEIMAGHKLFGIREQDNSYYYTVESYAASERLP